MDVSVCPARLPLPEKFLLADLGQAKRVSEGSQPHTLQKLHCFLMGYICSGHRFNKKSDLWNCHSDECKLDATD